MLIVSWCNFSCCWALLTLNQGLFSFPSAAASRCTRSWEDAWPGQLTQTGQRDIPYQRTSCPIYKPGEICSRRANCVFGWAGYWPSGGKQLYWALFVFLVFFLFYYCYHILHFNFKWLSQPTSFSFSTSVWGSGQVAELHLVAGGVQPQQLVPANQQGDQKQDVTNGSPLNDLGD